MTLRDPPLRRPRDDRDGPALSSDAAVPAGATRPAAAAAPPTFSEALRFWTKLGFISFGGPTGQIAVMHEELVERKRWIGEQRFLHALNYCMLLPGPEAQQLATYVGWLLHGARGGLAAGTLFVLPSVFILWGLSWLYVTYGELPWVAALFHGLKPAVTAIVAAAVIRIGRRALRGPAMWLLAAGAFLAIFVLEVPFPFIILTAGLLGWAGGKLWPAVFRGGTSASPEATRLPADSAAVAERPVSARAARGRLLRVVLVGLALWWAPVALLGAWLGWGSTPVREAVFFSKAALVTFGGAYAVLPYVAQRAVEDYGWLSAGQMLDGLGLAETTPGPLIMVVQFVAFLGGWNHPGGLTPLVAATVGALVTTWVTFVPCFMWIFAGAPYVERLRGNVGLQTALAAITAAVVGVILNLAVWFGVHVLFPAGGRLDLFALAVGAVAFVGMMRWRWGIVPVVLGAGLLGIVYLVVARAWELWTV